MKTLYKKATSILNKGDKITQRDKITPGDKITTGDKIIPVYNTWK